MVNVGTCGIIDVQWTNDHEIWERNSGRYEVHHPGYQRRSRGASTRSSAVVQGTMPGGMLLSAPTQAWVGTNNQRMVTIEIDEDAGSPPPPPPGR